jgi:hypothetical protein
MFLRNKACRYKNVIKEAFGTFWLKCYLVTGEFAKAEHTANELITIKIALNVGTFRTGSLRQREDKVNYPKCCVYLTAHPNILNGKQRAYYAY